MKTKKHKTIKLGKYTIRLVETGQNYGLNDCLKNDASLMIEFYVNSSKFPDNKCGYFISRYYLTTLANKDSLENGLKFDRKDEGISLCGYQPDLLVSSNELDEVIEKVAKYLGQDHLDLYRKNKKLHWKN